MKKLLKNLKSRWAWKSRRISLNKCSENSQIVPRKLLYGKEIQRSRKIIGGIKNWKVEQIAVHSRKRDMEGLVRSFIELVNRKRERKIDFKSHGIKNELTEAFCSPTCLQIADCFQLDRLEKSTKRCSSPNKFCSVWQSRST